MSSNAKHKKFKEADKTTGVEIEPKVIKPALLTIQDYCSSKGLPNFAKIAAQKLYNGQKKTMINWDKTLKEFNFKK